MNAAFVHSGKYLSGAVSAFQFLDPGALCDGDLRLTLHETLAPAGGRAPTYRFYMRHGMHLERAGRLELRLANTDDILLYTGHIGYNVDAPHRGHRLAARACRLVLDLAWRHEFSELWITCDPDNIPSRRTCELAGASFVSVVAVPQDHAFYKSGSHAKRRYVIHRSPIAEAGCDATNPCD